MIRTIRHHRARRRTGATTVELAFVAPFVLFLVFSSIEFTRMLLVRQALTNAAREGCRHACLATTLRSSDAEAFARRRLAGTISGAQDPNVVRINVTPTFSGGVNSALPIEVRMEVDCADVSWVPATLFAGAKIRTSASMVRE